MNRITRLSLATFMSLMSWLSVFGQGIVVEQSYTTDIEAQIEYVLAPLSMSPVTSGILLNRTLPIFPPELIGASSLQDSIWMDLSLLDAAYRSIYAARLPGFSGLPSPESAYANALGQYSPSNTVPIVLSVLEFHRFVEDPFESGLLDSINGQLRYAAGVNPSDAYITGRVYASGLFSYKVGQQVTFTLPSSYLIGNVSIAQTSIEVDADDGLGFRALSPGGTLSVTYATEGERILKIRFADASGTSAVHYHAVTVENTTSSANDRSRGGLRGEPLTFTQPERCPTCICDDITSDNGSATIRYCIRLSCLDANGDPSSDISKLKRPLIILDGIELTWDDNIATMQTILRSESRGMQFEDENILGGATLQDILDDNEYDVIFLDYHDHHVRIEENAAAFQTFLRMVNDIKAANGSPYKNIVMGISMGGLVGRYGLREMEINGEDHDVETYITFDSPIQGANVPLCVQGLIQHIADIGRDLPIPDVDPFLITTPSGKGVIKNPLYSIKQGFSGAVGFTQVINSPAARQLAKYNIYDPEGTAHRTFMNKLHNEMGPLQNCRTMAISNGSGSGGGGEISNSATAFDVSNPFGLDLLYLFLGIQVHFNIRGFTAPGYQNRIYDGSLRLGILWGLVRGKSELLIKPPANMIAIDMAPGGAIGLTAILEKNSSEENDENDKGLDLPSFVRINTLNFCFIPTVSALDIQPLGPDFIHSNLFNTDFSTSTYDDFSTQAGQVEITDPRRPEPNNKINVNNNTHVTMTFDNISTLLNNAKIGGEVLQNPLNSRTYNFGQGTGSTGVPFRGTSTPPNINTNLLITDRGKLWINRNNRIAYTDNPQNVFNNIGTHLNVGFSGNICTGEARQASVQAGGELSIGEWSVGNTGQLTLSEGTQLILGNGGELNIDHKSRLIVKAGATLYIKAGSELNILGDGFIEVEQGGYIEIESGSKIYLEKAANNSHLVKSGSVIKLSGSLIAVNGEIHIQGKGLLWIRNGHHFTSLNSNLTWRGHGKEWTSFRVDAPVEINDLNFQVLQARVMVNQSIFVDGGNCALRSSRFTTSGPQGFETLPESALFQAFQNYGKIGIRHNNINNVSVERCEFEDVPMFTSQFRSAFLDMVHSTTSNKMLNFEFNGGSKLMVRNSFITTGGLSVPFVSHPLPNMTKIGVSNISVFESKFQNTEISEFNRNNGRGPDPYADVQYTGIRQQASPYLYLEDCVISQCEKGVYAPDAVNIVMNHSRISDSHTGIEMTGSASTGLVKMMCSQLINNHTGIKGSDITLAIDAIINSQTTKSGGFTENYFDNTDSHFRICYKQKDFDWEIPARRNVWVNAKKYQIGYCPSGTDAELVQYPEGGGSCARQNVNSCDDKTPDFPIVNKSHAPSDYAELCLNQKTCQGDTILAKYWRGFTCYYNDDLQKAIDHLTPLAQDRYTFRDMNEKYLCTQITAEAHAFAGGQSEYTETDHDNNLIISARCRADVQGQKQHILTVDIPSFMLPVTSIEWHEYDGGQVSGSRQSPTIRTNGIGRYVVNVSSRNCLYTTTFIYEIHDIECEETVPGQCDNSCPEIENVQSDYSSNCHTLEIYSDTARTINITFRYYGILNGGNDYGNVETVSISVQLNEGLNSVEHCGIDRSQFWYDLITYEIEYADCVQCTYEEENLVIWMRPEGDNTYPYENTVSTLNQPGLDKVKVFPNPFTTDLQLALSATFEGDIFIEGYSSLGQNIFTCKKTLTAGDRMVKIEEMNMLTPGVYMLKIKYGSTEVIKKVIKMH